MATTSNSDLKTNFGSTSFMQPKYTIPFEAHAYEALITTVKSLESQEFDNVSQTLQDILRYCSHGSLLPIEVQEKMRNLKNDLSLMMSRVTSSQSALTELVDSLFSSPIDLQSSVDWTRKCWNVEKVVWRVH